MTNTLKPCLDCGGQEFKPYNPKAGLFVCANCGQFQRRIFTIKQVEQPEDSPVQEFFGWFCDGPEDDPRTKMIAFRSYLSIDQARERAIEYAIENNFANGFILLTAREIASAFVDTQIPTAEAYNPNG